MLYLIVSKSDRPGPILCGSLSGCPWPQLTLSKAAKLKSIAPQVRAFYIY